VSEDNGKERSAQCSQEDLSNARAIYFANDDELGELGGALDTALPSENLANKRRKTRKRRAPKTRYCINVSGCVSGIKTIEYISKIDISLPLI